MAHSAHAIDSATRAAAARHVRGATIAWGGGRYFDFAEPDASDMTIEDYAYALAYTVRWRGQARTVARRSVAEWLAAAPRPFVRCFYGVGQHVVEGATRMLQLSYAPRDCFDFLMHESDEVVFPDVPGPCKPLMPDAMIVVKRAGAAVDRRFGVAIRNPSLIKAIDVRMLVTEKRDLLGAPHGADVWHEGANGGTTSAAGFEPFPQRIVPYRHPDEAAERFLRLYEMLGGRP